MALNLNILLNKKPYFFLITISVISYLIILLVHLHLNNYDITRLIKAGDHYVKSSELKRVIYVNSNSFGYDGQFYYRLALDPLTNKETEDGITLDKPAYRQKRLIYPLISRLVSFKPSYIPYALVIINLLGIAYLSYLSCKLVIIFKRKLIYSLIIPFYPGFIFTLYRDLTEIIAISLLFTGIIALNNKKNKLAVLFFVLSSFTKETTLIIPIGILLAYLFFNKKANKNWLIISLVPIITYVIWHFVINYLWKNNGIDSLRTNLTIPLNGFFQLLKNLLFNPSNIIIVYIIEILFLLFFIYNVFVVLKNSKVLLYIKTAWIAVIMLVAVLNYNVFEEDIAFMRSCAELYLIGCFILIKSNTKYLKFHFFYTIFLWFYVFININQR